MQCTVARRYDQCMIPRRCDVICGKEMYIKKGERERLRLRLEVGTTDRQVGKLDSLVIGA